MNKIEFINFLKKINIKIYFGKGNNQKFKKEYGNDIYNKIYEYTSELNNTYFNNKKFTARLIYLIKYNGNINNIIFDNKIMLYSHKINDFKIISKNPAKKQWVDAYNKLNSLNEIYSLDDTKNIFKKNDYYKNFLGKSKNRTLLSLNPKLFKSLYFHTKIFDNININQRKFTIRLLYLVYDLNFYCNNCGRKNYFNYIKNNLICTCSYCSPKYPSIDWFKKTYNNEWEFYYNKRIENLKKLKTNSLDWYIKKYGEKKGQLEYRKRYIKQLENLNELKENRYSKISQNLFWKIYDILNNKNDIWFYELNNEYLIRIPENLNLNKNVFFVDFKQKNNIIEYIGKYWHNDIEIKERINILNKLGYNVLIITSDEYNKYYHRIMFLLILRE